MIFFFDGMNNVLDILQFKRVKGNTYNYLKCIIFLNIFYIMLFS